MAGKQLSIYLSEPEIKSLTDLAVRECRRPNDQARYILRQALGLTGSEQKNNSSVTGSEAKHTAVTNTNP